MKRSVCLIGAILAAAQATADWQVWTVTDTRRVLRDELSGGTRAVIVSAARNEWEGFQVLLRSERDVAGVGLQMSDLTGPAGSVIPATAFRLYRQHQFELIEPTLRNKDFRPGWYPDALIPFTHPLSGEPLAGARFAAVPFDLPAEQTHGFWVDLYVPRDAVAGQYTGTCRVTTAAGADAQIPVTLTVWDFELPTTPAMRTALGWPAERLRGYYATRAKAGKEEAPSDWAAVDEQCAELLSRHRLNADPPNSMKQPEPQPDGTYAFSRAQIEALREYVDRYRLNAVRMDRPARVVKDPETEKSKLHSWLRAFDQLARDLDRPHVVFYTYLKDEPNDEEAYKFVQRWGRAIREANSALKVLVVEQTLTQNEVWGDLYGAVDIWCALFPLHDDASARKRMALGEEVWAYTALCQRSPETPFWQTDYPLLNYRVPAWQAWRFGINGLLYWGGMVYWRGVEDVWTDPKTLDRRNQPDRKPNPELLYNGEGSLLYPGRAVGYEGVAPSLRFKALRDGLEDYEYLALLDKAGRSEAALSVTLAVASSWFQWDRDPAAYQQARAKLAELLVKAGEKK